MGRASKSKKQVSKPAEQRKTLVIGVMGYARAGKDSFYHACCVCLMNARVEAASFAYEMKKDLAPLMKAMEVNLDGKYDPTNPNHKHKTRPIYEGYGTHVVRKFDPDHWNKRAKPHVDRHMGYADLVVITDVRNANEVRFVTDNYNGEVVLVVRQDSLATPLEFDTIGEALRSYPGLFPARIVNNGDLAQYVDQVLNRVTAMRPDLMVNPGWYDPDLKKEMVEEIRRRATENIMVSSGKDLLVADDPTCDGCGKNVVDCRCGSGEER